MKATNATQLLLLQIKAEGLPQPRLEYRFHPTRKWRFDLAWATDFDRDGVCSLYTNVAVEIDGAVWTQGRHTRGSGYIKDMEKLNAAVELGWRVFRYEPEMIKSGAAIQQLKRVLIG